MSRKYLIAGNWKMNKTAGEASELAKSVVSAVGSDASVDIAICPPFTSIDTAGAAIADAANVSLGAQNMHFEASGAYTGEISAAMLKASNVEYVILGHSERREYFGETDEIVNKKTLVALENGLKPIVCVGETLGERESDKTLDVIATQIKGGLASLTADKVDDLVIAYEPVWAIGTGKTATPDMAQEVHAAIRSMLAEQFGAEVADGIRILYGGSMKPANADELLAQADIDGGLIGGAALDADSFSALVASAKKA